MRAVTQFLRNYRVPFAVLVAAALLSPVLWPLGPRGPFALFLGAVLISAWWGGWRTALVTTVVAVATLALLSYLKAPPGEALDDTFLRLGMFVLVGLLGGYLSQQCQRAIRAVDHVHDILAGGGLALIAADAQGRVTSLNSLARALTGWGQADASGTPLDQMLRLIDGQTRRPLVLPLAEVLAGAEPHHLPDGAVLQAAGGGEAAVEGAVAPVRGEDGKAAGVVITFRAAAERARVLDDLRQRAERFRALAGHAPAPLLVLDAEGKCVFTNPAGQAACDCSAEECLGEGWSRHVVAQDRDRVLSHWPAALVARQPFSDELRVRPPGGETRWFRLRASPMLADGGGLLGQVATLEDVTERKETEERLCEERRLGEARLAAGESRAEDARRECERLAEEVRAAHESQLQAELEAEGARREGERVAQERLAAERRAEEAVRDRDRRGEELRAARDRADESEEARRDAERRAEEVRVENEPLIEELKAARARAEEARGEAERRAEERQRLALEGLTEQVRQLTSERSRLEEALATTDADLARRADEGRLIQAQAEEAIRQAREELRRHQDAHGASSAEADELRRALESSRQQTAAREEELRQARAESRGHAEQHALTRAGADELRQAWEGTRKLAADHEESLRQAREELRRHQEEYGTLRAGAEQLRGELTRHQETAEELRRNLDALRSDKDFLEAVIEGSPDGIFAHDRDGRCRVWNAALERLLKRPKAEALNRTAFELFPSADGGETGSIPEGWRVDGAHALPSGTHAPVRSASGEVVGGMALVRAVAKPSPEPRRGDGARLPAPRSEERGDTLLDEGNDWLAFN